MKRQQNKSECIIHQKQFIYKSTIYNIIIITKNQQNQSKCNIHQQKMKTTTTQQSKSECRIHTSVKDESNTFQINY